jgi:hypothetical protein
MVGLMVCRHKGRGGNVDAFAAPAATKLMMEYKSTKKGRRRRRRCMYACIYIYTCRREIFPGEKKKTTTFSTNTLQVYSPSKEEEGRFSAPAVTTHTHTNTPAAGPKP